MKYWYGQSEIELENELKTNVKTGLQVKEVQERLSLYGKNVIAEEKKKGLLSKFIKQLIDPMIVILLIATFISLVIGEFINAIIIAVIIIANALIGVFQENKAENALEAIGKMTLPHAQVVRNGVQELVSVTDVVPGDIIILEAGDYVSADMRIIEAASLKTEESSLTGESMAVEKVDTVLKNEEIHLAERKNMAFMGSVVTYGRGVGIVVATGMNTQIGSIAKMIQRDTKESTPIQRQLKKLSKVLGTIAIVACILIFFISLGQGLPLYDVFLVSFSLAVAAVPEGLPAIVTVVLAVGMRLMAKENAIMKTLPAVETSGSATVICSDKTGTLTQNKMTVTNVLVNNSLEGIGDLDLQSETVKKLLEFGVLCNDTNIEFLKDKYETIGDPTEVALIDLVINKDIDPRTIIGSYARIEEKPFDSDRKLMTTVNKINGRLVAITKGAPDVFLNLCNTIEVNGLVSPVTKEELDLVAELNNTMSRKALRSLAFGYKILDASDKEEIDLESLEKDMTFLGLMGMIDPPREEAKEAIRACKTAGIRPIMITGDHETTANAIGMELGIVTSDQESLDGADLNAMTPEELAQAVKKYSIFARVSPEDKLKLIDAFHANNEVVVMTGDGVNDAPALKAADIGVAMGITGTEVAKGASDMILVDDDFATIVSAVKYGRIIYDNIKKAIHFLISGNVGEIIAILLASILGNMILGVPIILLTAVQILWINLVSDSFLAIALGMEKGEKDIMERPPRKPHESLFAGGLAPRIFYHGFSIGVLTFLAYIIGYKVTIVGSGASVAAMTAGTMAFMTLAFCQFMHVMNVRSLHNSIFSVGVFKNKYLNLAILLNIVLQLLTITIPFLREKIFGLVLLTPLQWIIVLGLSSVIVLITEIEKAINRRRRNALMASRINK